MSSRFHIGGFQESQLLGNAFKLQESLKKRNAFRATSPTGEEEHQNTTGQILTRKWPRQDSKVCCCEVGVLSSPLHVITLWVFAALSERNQALAANNNLLLHQRKLKVFENIFLYYALMKPTVLLSLGCTIFHLNKCGVTTWQIVFLDFIDLIPHLNDLLCFLLWPKYGWRCLLAVRVTEERVCGHEYQYNHNTATVHSDIFFSNVIDPVFMFTSWLSWT